MGRALLFWAIIFGTGFAYFGKNLDLRFLTNNKIKQQSTQDNLINDYDPSNDEQFSKEERDYFKEVAKKSEFTSDTAIRRWNDDIRIYVVGDKVDYLMEELDKIIGELNEIIQPIDLKIVNEKSKANLTIYLTGSDEYVEVEPIAKKYVGSNWGLFVIQPNVSFIESATVFVNMEECFEIQSQKHLLREELTQSLGLRNDSYTYPESIFYSKWTETTEYTDLDRSLIDMLYNHW
jgi:hypothetical protein